MTQDEIIEMAKTVRSSGYWDAFDLITFAKLVAAKEREACAKECEHTAVRMGSEWMAQHCANAIRARGEA